MRFRIPLCATAALFAASVVAWGHYSWLARTHYNASGDTAFLEIGLGHDFPASEQAPSTTNLQAFLALPSGSRQPVKITTAPKSLKLEVKLPSKALARVYYVRDRGVQSQTASGWKEGGRKQFPDAKASRRMLSYGIAWVGFDGSTANAAPLGLELELNYEAGLRGRLVRVWRKGKPARDVEVTAVLGEDREIKLGKTDHDGYAKVAETVPEHRPVLFSVSLRDKAPKGADYDEDTLSCTLALPSE